jgi:hypothetical protein
MRCGFIRMLAFVFADKRLTATALVVWLLVVVIVFSCLGVLNSDFFRFGPSPSLRFMNFPIDSVEKWVLLALYSFVDSLFKSFSHDSIIPWLNNTIADPKSRILPYRRVVCLAIVEVYFAYVHVSTVMKVFLSLAQVDFVLINALSDLGMKVFSCNSFMRGKMFVEEDQDSQVLIKSENPAAG